MRAVACAVMGLDLGEDFADMVVLSINVAQIGNRLKVIDRTAIRLPRHCLKFFDF